eukprot:747226-Hanusia_phi.AAC.1
MIPELGCMAAALGVNGIFIEVDEVRTCWRKEGRAIADNRTRMQDPSKAPCDGQLQVLMYVGRALCPESFSVAPRET